MADYPTVVVAKFDGTENEVPGLQLFAFPTLTIYKAGNNEEVQYRGQTRSVEAFKSFLIETVPNLKTKAEIEEDRRLGIEQENQQEEKKKKNIDEKSDAQKAVDKDELALFSVTEISDDEFESEIIDQTENVVVLLYANWMDDKEELLNKWKEVALEFRFVTAIKILQSDGDRYKKWDVHMFPTIKMFKAHTKGETPSEVIFKGKDLKITNIASWIRENAVRTKEEEEIRKSGGNVINKGGSFEGFHSVETETQSQQSLYYHDDL